MPERRESRCCLSAHPTPLAKPAEPTEDTTTETMQGKKPMNKKKKKKKKKKKQMMMMVEMMMKVSPRVEERGLLIALAE